MVPGAIADGFVMDRLLAWLGQENENDLQASRWLLFFCRGSQRPPLSSSLFSHSSLAASKHDHVGLGLCRTGTTG